MKKAVLLMAAVSMSFANAGRSAGSASTSLVFSTEVVAGCAVNLASDYASQTGAAYNGTDATPEVLSISATSGESDTILRCQTGTGVSISAGETSAGFNAGIIDSAPSADVVLNGNLNLTHERWAGNSYYAGNDNKTLRGAYKVTFTKRNTAGGNGDTYALKAAFTPTAGQFEPLVGKYSGTLNVAINY